MHIAVVNIFDALPGEPMHEGRYIALCRAMVRRGHAVDWYTCDWQHHRKEPRQVEVIREAAARERIRVHMVSSPSYRQNTSLRRLRCHRSVAAGLDRLWRGDVPRPDAILTSLPPPNVASAAARWADRTEAAYIIDVQDLWPQTFARFWPAGLGWMNHVAFAGMAADARKAYHRADAAIVTADAFWCDVEGYLRSDARRASLTLGVDLSAFDSAIRPLESLGLSKPPGQRWLFLSGSLGSYFDLEATVSVMLELNRRRKDLQLIVVGSGPAEEAFRKALADAGVTNATLMGNQSYETYVSVMVACDVGLLPIRADACVYMPNRVFQYWAAGLPTVNTIPGQLADIIERNGAGINCPSGDAMAMADATEKLLAHVDPGATAQRCIRRKEWILRYDRREISIQIAELVEDVVENRTV